MQADALRAGLSVGNVEGRIGLLRALSDQEIVALTPSLFAVLITDSSLQVRRAAEEALARRPTELARERPAPLGSLTKEKVASVAESFAGNPDFVGVLLGSDQGRTLLARLPLERLPIDDALLEVTRTLDAALVPKILALPIDLSGRAGRLLEAFPEFERARRQAISDALVWSALCGTTTPLESDAERAKQSFGLWVDGLVAGLESGATPPSYAEFLRAGGRLTSGPVEQQATAPSPESIRALEPLARLATLAIASSRNPVLERSVVADALESPLDDLRVVGWSLLARNGLAQPTEILAAAKDETSPGVVTELLELLGIVPPERTDTLCAFLEHPRASARLAAARVLARSPLCAALASASLDPRAEGVPLNVLAAQPDALADPTLVAYLSVPRSSALTARALRSLQRPPPPSWERWGALLSDPSPRVRRAARLALLRLPVTDGPGVDAFVPRLLADAPLEAVRVIERFGLTDRREHLDGLLLDAQVSEPVALSVVRVLRSHADPRSWETLWAFVSGDPPRLRYGTRRSRRAALEALLVIPPPPPPPGQRRAEPPRVLTQLLTDRDPSSVELALRYLQRHPSAAGGETRDTIYDLLLALLGEVRRTGAQRRRRAAWRRFLRLLVPRAWVRPRPTPRGRGARLLTRLLEATLDLGIRGIWAAELAPALGHAAPAVRRAGVRLSLSLHRGSLAAFVSTLPDEATRDAIVAAQQPRAEALLASTLSRAVRGDRSAAKRAHAWLLARPLASAVPYLEQLLATPGTQAETLASLAAIHATPEGAGPAAAIATRELATLSLQRDSGALRRTADLLEALGQWSLVPRLLPALAWASETARTRVVDLLRRALSEGAALNAGDLSPLLEHPLSEVRVLALSLLRSSNPPNLWEAIRPHGPGRSTPLPTAMAKPFLGACEEHYELSMSLALERLLAHPNGEVARRALKLINRRERELATLTLLRSLDDPELRQPILTTFSTWSARFLDAGLSTELREEARRKIRTTIAALAENAHPTQTQEAARAALADGADASPEAQVPYVRAAALYGIGRLHLSELTPAVADALASGDPLLQRPAAWAAGELPVADSATSRGLTQTLHELAASSEPELRATSRAALINRLDPTDAGTIEGLLTDPAPEVRLHVLAALRARPETLASVTLEARLADADPRMREQVLLALAERRPSDPGILRGPLSDPSPEVRLAAIQAVAAWDALEAVRYELGERLADPSIHVSGKALELLGDVGPEATPEDEDADEDENADDAAPSRAEAPHEQ